MRFLALCALSMLYVLPAAADPAKTGAVYNLGKEEQKQYQALTPQERAQVNKEAAQKWESMGIEEKKATEAKARKDFEALSTVEQQKMKQEALQFWQDLTPEEQQELRRQFPDLLKGELVLDPGS